MSSVNTLKTVLSRQHPSSFQDKLPGTKALRRALGDDYNPNENNENRQTKKKKLNSAATPNETSKKAKTKK